MADSVTLGGKEFPKQLFDELMAKYAEAFSYSSLSIESSYEKIKKYREILRVNYAKNAPNIQKYLNLPENEQKEIMIFINENFDQCLHSYVFGKDEEINHKLFEYFFTDHAMWEYTVGFNEDKFDSKMTKTNIKRLVLLISKTLAYEKETEELKKNYIDAFYYALSLDKIGTFEIQKINYIVLYGIKNLEGFQPGYRKIDNMISGANFVPADKKFVPQKMMELIYLHEHNWGEPMLEVQDDMSEKELHEHWNQVCLKEAKFHISFERIHPFEDGNGRTGRILLVTNLIKSKMAPVLITGAINRTYKSYINDNNYEGFARDLVSWSIQTQTLWVSELRSYENVANKMFYHN